MTTSDAYWRQREAEYNPVNGSYGPAATLDNPAGFRAYMVMTKYGPDRAHELHKISDLYGRERWLNDKGWRVMALALLHIASGTQTSLTVMADKIGCARMTVSRWITKLTAWGVIGSGVVRGRYGGIVLFARTVTDNLEHWATVARAKIARIRARKLNAHPDTQGGKSLTYLLVSKGVHLDYGDPHARRERLLDALNINQSRRQGMVRCPAHEDRLQSLSYKMLDDTRMAMPLLLHCFAGCTYQEIVKAVL